MAHVHFVTVDGVALGPLHLGARSFLPGDEIQWLRGNLRVLDVVDMEAPERFTILVVETV